MANNTTPIFGRLKNVTKENPYVAGAVDIKDDLKNKNQQVINQETDRHLAEHDEHLGIHDTEIADRYTKEEVNNIVSRTPETDVIVIEVPAESQSDIAGWLDANTSSGIDPETGRSIRANKLYRVPGPDNTTFSEWAWDGTKYIMLANKDYGIDDEPTLGSNNLVKSGGVAGMYGHYTDNPEFLYVMKDIKQRILLALRKDGQVMFGAGIPYQVKEYVDAKIAEILGDDDLTESIDSLKEVVAFLKDFKNSDTLKQLLDAKVDKEEGKSLINKDYADGVHYIENPEFLDAKTDHNQKLLEGTRVDGTKVFTGDVEIEKNLRLQGKVADTLRVDKISQDSFVTEVIDNPEWERLLLTEDGRIIFGIRKDCSIEWSVGVPVPIQKAIGKIYEDGVINSFKYVSNPEYLLAVTDNEGHFLFGVTVEGVFRAAKLELPESEAETWLDEVYSIIEDPEDRLEITLDKDSRVLGYRDKDGTRYEEKFKTNHLSLTPTGMTEFQQALKDTGFNPGGGGDLSNKSSIEIPEPRCAYINISGIDSMPEVKGNALNGWMEVYDGAGNFFKKRVILDAQGDSSTQQAKKNFAADFCEDNWEGDDTTDIKIGSWVSQDSYHFKAYYTSLFKAECPIAYKLWDDMCLTRGMDDDRPYKEYYAANHLSNGVGIGDSLEENVGTGARTFPDGFPCVVYLNDVFYGIFIWQLKKHRDNMQMGRNKTDNIHIEGEMGWDEFWNGTVAFGNPGVEIRNPKPKKWNLLCQDGSKYDFDKGHRIPMDESSDFYDATNKSCVNSAKTKHSIEELAAFISEVSPYEEQYKAGDITLDEFKSELEKRISMSWLIDYILLVCFIQDSDSVRKNWQWTTWGKKDGRLKWYVCPYDLDAAFGVISTTSFSVFAPTKSEYGKSSSANTPAYYVWAYYLQEMKQRYAELRNKGVFSYDNVIGKYRSWIDRIGFANFEREYKKWSESPCQRDSYISDDWEFTGKQWITFGDTWGAWEANKTYNKYDFAKYNHRPMRSKVDGNIGHLPTDENYWYDAGFIEGTTYQEGKTVYAGYGNFYQFRAKRETSENPFVRLYSSYPFEGGIYDSIYRIAHWIEDKIVLMDEQMEYNNN